MLLFLSPTGANRVQNDYCEKHAAHIQALGPVRCLARSRAVISNKIYIWGDFSVNKMTLSLQETCYFYELEAMWADKDCSQLVWRDSLGKKKKKKPFKCWRMDSWYEKSEWWMFPQRRQCREMSLHCNAGCSKTKSWMTVSSTWFFTKCKCALTFQVRRSETRVYLVTNSERGSLSQYKSQFHQLLPEQQSNPLLI